MRYTKIICTIGPASNSPEMMKNLLKAGMNVARLNFSHGNHEEHHRNIVNLRKTKEEMGLPLGILLDTKGPEIRTGIFENGKINLIEGQDFTLTSEDVLGNSNKVSVTYKNLPKEMRIGDLILINDGMIAVKVKSKTETELICKVIHGGELKDHKGINVPNVDIGMEYLSNQDKEDLLFGIKEDVDFVAASFVRNANDARDIREFLVENGGKDIKIIAKIESTQGIDNFEEILPIVDGIMVARGDMGVEVPFQLLPGIQKKLIRRCVQQGKIVITATQMLESMISSPIPTRAEINDVANAVFDGTSAVMLSAESAAGMYPQEAVNAMAKILSQAEEDCYKVVGSEQWLSMNSEDVTNAVGHAACTLAKDIKAKAIIAVTSSGYTANKVSKFRPYLPIIGITPNEKVFNQLSLSWGVEPLKSESTEDMEELCEHCVDKVLNKGSIKRDDTVVLTAGFPTGIPGTTNTIRVFTPKGHISSQLSKPEK